FNFSNELFQDIYLYKANPLGYSLYLLSFALGILHFRFYMKKETDLKYNNILTYFIILVIYSLPIFVLGCDWGRCLQIHFVFLFKFLTFKLKNIEDANVLEKSELIYNKITLPYLLLVPFILFWQVRLYDLGFWFKGLTRIISLFN